MTKLHVVVAHDSETIRESVSRLLEESGYRVTAVSDGVAVAARLEDGSPPPAAMVLDAAISGVFAFELIDLVKARGLPTRTLLISSIYNRTVYKRTPASLYGADDYVEQHHIPDKLVPKLSGMLDQPPADGNGIDGAVAREADGIHRAGESRLRIRYRTADEGVERARRLAAILIADIALYNEDLGDLPDDDERAARLREDLEDARLLFDLRVPHEIRDREDYLAVALDEWLGRRPPAGDGRGEVGDPMVVANVAAVAADEES